MAKIVVLGSNFSGVDVALKLKKRLKDAEITVIDREKTTEFYPSMYEIISGRKSAPEIEIDLAKLYSERKINFVNSEVKSIDNKAKKVIAADSSVDYDYLVITLGDVSNYYGIKGAKEYTLSFKTIEDAMKVKLEAERLLKEKSAIRVAVVGSGLTGIELVFEFSEYLKRAAKNKAAEITLIEAKDQICPWANDKTREYISKLLEKDKIAAKTGFSIKEITKDSIIGQAEALSTDLVVWCAGIMPSPVIDSLSIEKDRGGIIVDDYFRSVSDQNIYACGDIISKKLDDGFILPKTAHFAMVEASLVAGNLEKQIKSQELKKFTGESSPPVLVDVGRFGAFLTYRKGILKSPGWFWHAVKNIIEKWWIYSRRYA